MAEVKVIQGTITQIACENNHSLALLNNGTVRGFGNNDEENQDFRGEGRLITQIAGGLLHSLALLNDGTVRGWGKTQ